MAQHGRSLAHPGEGNETGLAGALLPEVQPRVCGPRGRGRPADAGKRDKRGGGLPRALQGVQGGRWWMRGSKENGFYNLVGEFIVIFITLCSKWLTLSFELEV